MAFASRLSPLVARPDRVSGTRRYFARFHCPAFESYGPALQRSFMYVPADKEAKLKKMANPSPSAIYPDILVLNCEDGVSLSNKESARNNVAHLLNDVEKITAMRRYTEVAVRINSIESGFAEEDLRTAMSSKAFPDVICLPKVDSVQHLQWLSDNLARCDPKPPVPMLVIAMIESARSLVDLVQICRFACEPKTQLAFRLQGLVFGSDDFCSTMGVSRTPSNAEVLYARQHLVTVAKAFNLSAIDMVNIDIKDLTRLEAECAEGARLGFSGKQVIHPAQLPVVHAAFRPAPDRVRWARALLKEVENAGGTGTLVFQGQMIDEPTVLQARQLHAMAVAVEEKEARYSNST